MSPPFHGLEQLGPETKGTDGSGRAASDCGKAGADTVDVSFEFDAAAGARRSCASTR